MLAFLGGGVAHPLHGNGYQLWSGVESDAQQWVEWLISLAVVAWGARKAFSHWKQLHECHVDGCKRISWHVHPSHGHPLCHPHYREAEKGTVHELGPG